jgi:hypothetical protein
MRGVRRETFFFNLGALGAAFLLIVAAAALGPDAAKGIGLGIGVACTVVSIWFVATLPHRRRFAGHPELRVRGRRVGVGATLAGAITSAAIWETIQVAVFNEDVSRWLTLANGLVIGSLGCAGLVVHEISTDRVTWVLEVFDRHDPPR